ncbi:hypothetical protein AMTRI_Chr05g72890 [Amborella trichopoda]
MAKAKADGAMATAKGTIALYVENGPDSGDDLTESDPKLWWLSAQWLLNPLVLGLELVESGYVVDSSSCKKSERRD